MAKVCSTTRRLLERSSLGLTSSGCWFSGLTSRWQALATRCRWRCPPPHRSLGNDVCMNPFSFVAKSELLPVPFFPFCHYVCAIVFAFSFAVYFTAARTSRVCMCVLGPFCFVRKPKTDELRIHFRSRAIDVFNNPT